MFEIFCVPTAKLTTLNEILHSKQIKDKVREQLTLAWKDETKYNNTFLVPNFQDLHPETLFSSI